MKKYIIFDIRNGLGKSPDVIVEEESPYKAVQKLYTDVKRDYSGTGDIVVHNNRGSYVYNGKRNNVKIMITDNNKCIYTEFYNEGE